MRLLEESKAETNGHGVNGNGNGIHTNGHCEDTDSESEVEDVEPVSATLVLRVVSEPASPSVSRKSSFRRSDQPPTFLTEETRGEQFLQVQVQRSTSSGSINGIDNKMHNTICHNKLILLHQAPAHRAGHVRAVPRPHSTSQTRSPQAPGPSQWRGSGSHRACPPGSPP